MDTRSIQPLRLGLTHRSTAPAVPAQARPIPSASRRIIGFAKFIHKKYEWPAISRCSLDRPQGRTT